MFSSGIASLPSFLPRTDLLNTVVETPFGTTVKLKYDDAAGVFRAHKAMPIGFEFPLNFGFVPGTAAQDGDPLDVLLLSSHGIPVGTVVPGRILSVLEAEQTEKKVKNRNDRVIAIPWDMVSHGPMLPKLSFDPALKHAIAMFFRKYNEAQGKGFRPLRFTSARRGIQIVRKAMKAAKNAEKA